MNNLPSRFPTGPRRTYKPCVAGMRKKKLPLSRDVMALLKSTYVYQMQFSLLSRNLLDIIAL